MSEHDSADRERRDSIPRYTIEQVPGSIYFRLVEDKTGAWVAYRNHNVILSRVEDSSITAMSENARLAEENARLKAEASQCQICLMDRVGGSKATICDWHYRVALEALQDAYPDDASRSTAAETLRSVAGALEKEHRN